MAKISAKARRDAAKQAKEQAQATTGDSPEQEQEPELVGGGDPVIPSPESVVALTNPLPPVETPKTEKDEKLDKLAETISNLGEMMQVMQEQMQHTMAQVQTASAAPEKSTKEPIFVEATQQRVFGIRVDAILPPNGDFSVLEETCTENELLERGADIQWMLEAEIIVDQGVQLVHAQ